MKPSARIFILLLVAVLIASIGVVYASPITISGVAGSTTTDPAASNGQYYLRYTGNPAPAGYAHDYQWASPELVCYPDTEAVVFEGSIDVSAMPAGQVTMIGLLDRENLAAGNSEWQSGAYIYVYRTPTTLRIGPSDGNQGGEIVQTFATITPAPTGILSVTFTVDGAADPATCAVGPLGASPEGCMYLTVDGYAPMADSYGSVKHYTDTHREFVSGAQPGWDDYLGSMVAYDFELSGCEVIDEEAPVATDIAPATAAINEDVLLTAIVDDTFTGWSTIVSAEYSLNGGTDWLPLDAVDGSFDEINEAVQQSIGPFTETQVLDVCINGTDALGNVGPSDCTFLAIYDPSAGFVTGGGWIDGSVGESGPIYDTLPVVLPGSYPSLGYQATSTDEAGDRIQFAGAERSLDNVVITLTNWACENDFDFVDGTWVPNRGGSEACVTTPGTGFNHPITLNIYGVDESSGEPQPGALLASKTETFFIPFRPSWDANSGCTGPAADVPFGGTWFDPVTGNCVHGFNSTHTFDFAADGLVLPDEIIYGVAYNTHTHGANPLGVNGPYSSLNLALTDAPASVGLDPEMDELYWDTSHGPFYCDGGTGGVDSFRRDYAVGCWGYTPVVEFNVATLVEGRADFGFVSKYKKGASVPDGNTEFVFEAAGLDFHSTSYEWLVVNQGGTNAQFKGSGTINGQGDYNFMLWAGDGATDTFRIKIWYEVGGDEVVVYDNGSDQVLGGGNIVVHK